MTDASKETKRRALNVLVGLPLTALTIGTAATQFVAWRLNYDPALGRPVFGPIYLPWRFINWWMAPWASQVDTTFSFLRLGLCGVACLGLLALSKAGKKKPIKHETIHGTSRFVKTDAEIRQIGLLPPKGKPPGYGIVLGAWEHKNRSTSYMTLTMNYNVISFGPPRSGKTAGVLEPTLLTWPYSVVVWDPKAEIYRKTAGWRSSEAGNYVLRWAPADIENTVTWNPFDRVRIGTLYEYRDVANIMAQITDPTGSGKGPTDHWEPTAANLMTGLALYLIHTTGGASLSKMLELIDASSDLNDILKKMAASPQMYAAQVGRGMIGTQDRERATIISTARRLLLPYRDPIIAKNTSSSDFSIDQIMNADKPVSLYIEVRGEDELRIRPLVRLFLSLMTGQLISLPPKVVNGREVGPHKHPLKICIDEFASLDKMQTVELGLSKSPGFDITFLLLVQDYQQIEAIYGRNENITGQCQVLTSYAPNNQKTRDWLSAQTGRSTEVVEEVSESVNSGRRSQNVSYRSSQRPLMTPDEVGRIKGPVRDRRDKDRVVGPGETLILHTGEYPILAKQSLSFLDPEFRRRMSIPAPPTMTLRNIQCDQPQDPSPLPQSYRSAPWLRAVKFSALKSTPPDQCRKGSGE